MKQKITVSAAGLFLLCLMLMDCRCSRSQIVINKVLIELPQGPHVLLSTEKEEDLRKVVGLAVAHHPGFNFNVQKTDGAVLRLSFLKDNRNKEKVMLQAILSRTSASEGDTLDTAAFAHIDLKDALVLDQVKRAIGETLNQISKLIRGGAIDKGALTKLLERAAQDEEVPLPELVNAILLLGTEKDHECRAAIVKLISRTEDSAVVNACLIALSELGDEESMEAIIEFSERKSPFIRRQAVAAARKIASPLALQWLIVMAYGHEDSLVRQEALEAMNEVEAKLWPQGVIDG